MTQSHTTVYDPRIKAKVIADYQVGTSQLALVRKYDIPRTTIRQWTKGLGQPLVTAEIKRQIDAEVVKLTFTAIRSLRAILRHARNPDWLQEQSAHDLGVFFGITADKLTAVLAAFERGQEIQDAIDAVESSSSSDSNI